MIKIIDYGLGNVQAFLNVYKLLNIPASSAGKISELQGASHLILPGVGSFDQAMHLLNDSGMRDELDNLVLEAGLPILGVCVGMQILGIGSQEGIMPGLGWINGDVKKITSEKSEIDFRLPHMGWNEVSIKSKDELFTGLEEKPQFYFLHNYHFVCTDEHTSIGTTNYGKDISCIVKSKNIYGVQFHPEKSHHYGVSLLKNFSELNFA